MPLSHVFAEGIGPFKKVHLDLRGADGHPSLGPHILAGVNGSGKSAGRIEVVGSRAIFGLT